MTMHIRELILFWYAYPHRKMEREATAQHGERSVRWHG